MGQVICAKCMRVHEKTKDGHCPGCGASGSFVYKFKNSDEYLKGEAARVKEERERAGLEGLVGGLECVIINTEPLLLPVAVFELLRYTGLELTAAFQDLQYQTCVLKTPGSADFLLRSRRAGDNPFLDLNRFPKSQHLPNTRLETFVFATPDIEKYVAIQKARGVKFLTNDIMHTDRYSFIQTSPSSYTGNSVGLIQWRGERGNYVTSESKPLDWKITKLEGGYQRNIKYLDHTATG